MSSDGAKGGPDRHRRDRAAGIDWNRMISFVLIGLAAFALGGWFWTLTRSPGDPTAAPAASSSTGVSAAGSTGQVLRDGSHRLSVAPDQKVTFVEFLDFECEACGALYPVVEDLRQRYAGRVTFVVRYLPLESHVNSMRAARAVEAAAQQGRFEDMYSKLFASQSDWGERQRPADVTFRGYVAELGLDMARWDADYVSPTTMKRIQTDLDDARALGLTGTPSLFLNGQPLQPESVEDLTRALDEALAQ